MKPLLVYYINVDNMPPSEIHEYIESVGMSVKDNDYKITIIPVHNQPTKVECVNPIFIPTEYYEKYKLNFKLNVTCKLKKLGEMHGRTQVAD